MKRFLFLFIIGALLLGCSPCKRLSRHCPPQVIRETKDSLIIRDSITYRDRLIPVHIKGESQIVDGPKIPGKELINLSPVELENTYAVAMSWVENSVLRLQLLQKDQIINMRIDSAEKIAKHWEYLYKFDRQKEVVEKKYIPKFYRICTFSFIFGFMLLICIILYRLRSKIKKLLI